MDKNIKPCALYRHQLFRAGYACCLICNPGVDSERLAKLLRQPGIQAYYDALLAGTECHALKCQKPGIHDDGLEHWWCDDHIYQCLFLQEGAKRDFPAWEWIQGHTILAGRPAWYKNAVTCDDLDGKVAKLLGISVRELRARYAPVPPAPTPVEIPEPVQPLVVEADELDLSTVAF